MKEEKTVSGNPPKQKSLYYYLSAYRSELMGFAILWVVWFHSSMYVNFFPVSILNVGFSFVKDIGYGGVDIFLLISGMGIYNSLEKNDISQYIKNRVRRIAPAWWIFLIISVIIGRFLFEIYYTKLEIIGFATFTGFWLDMKNQGNWYVYAIMLFYMISPVFHSLFKTSKNRSKTLLILVFISLIVSVSFVGNFKLIVFSRVPIYLMGMYISASLKNTALKKSHWAGIITACVAGFAVLLLFYIFLKDYLWKYGLWWYPFIVIAPALSLLIAKCLDSLKRILKPLMSVLTVFGKSSLEILLVSDFMFENSSKSDLWIFNNHFAPVFVVIISLILGIAFHYLIDFILRQFGSKTKSLKNKA